METLKYKMLKAIEKTTMLENLNGEFNMNEWYAKICARVAEEDKRQFLIQYITRFSTDAGDGKFRQLQIEQGLKWFDNEYLKSLKSGGNQTA